MKKPFVLVIMLLFVLSSTACNLGDVLKTDATPTPSETPVSFGGNDGNDEEEIPPTVTPTPRIPPNGIWTFTGEISRRLVLEEGYYADYAIELDFVKLEGNYPSGRYVGDVYFTFKVDAEDYIKEALKNVPAGIAGINFDVVGYGLRNDVPITVQNLPEFQKEGYIWRSFESKNADGEEVTPGNGEYVAESSLTMPYKFEGAAGGWGDTGGGSFKLGDFDMSGEGDSGFWIRLIIEPDSVWGEGFYTEAPMSRKVQVFINANGVTLSGEGVLERIPYGAVNIQNKVLRERLGEKYGVDETN